MDVKGSCADAFPVPLMSDADIKTLFPAGLFLYTLNIVFLGFYWTAKGQNVSLTGFKVLHGINSSLPSTILPESILFYFICSCEFNCCSTGERLVSWVKV